MIYVCGRIKKIGTHIYFEPKNKYPGKESVNILTRWTAQLTK
jgi:hypothetical protein